MSISSSEVLDTPSDVTAPDVESEAVIAAPPAAVERYRLLALRVDRRLAERPRAERGGGVVVVTSPSPGDGKTTTALHLGSALAQTLGRKVVVVDAHLHAPKIARFLGLEVRCGLADVARGSATLDQALRRAGPGPLALLPGSIARIPTPSVNALAPVVTSLRERYDVVLLDTPSATASADASALARLADGVLLVIRAERTKREALGAALEALVNAPLLGCVVTSASRSFLAWSGTAHEGDHR